MSGSISSLYLTDPEAASALRRQRLAEALMQQGKEPMTHPLQVAGHWAQALVGALMSRRSDEELKQLGERRRADRTSFMNDITGALGGGAPTPQASGLGAPPVSLAPNIAPAGGSASASGGASPSPELASLYQQHAQRTGIPVELLMAQGQQESGFNPNIVGRAGEVGLGQIKPSTAASPGFGVAPVDPSKLTDPATNIAFQADYLAGRGRAAGVTDWTQRDQQARALRAYNGGGDPQYAEHVMGRMAGFGGAQSPAATPISGQARDAVNGGQPDANAGRNSRQDGVDPATMRQLAIRAATSDDPHIQSLAPILAQFAAKAAPRQPVSVAPGNTLVEPDTGRQIYTSPDKGREPTETWQDATITVDGRKISGQRSSHGQFRPFSQQSSEAPVAVQTPDGPRFVSRAEAVGQPPADPQRAPLATRPLSDKTRSDLDTLGGTTSTLTRLNDTFKNEFAGYGVTAAGEAAIAAKRAVGDSSGQVQWWQDYAAYQNGVRHQLFGSALTPTEQNQWSKANVNPGMAPEEVRKNLARQKQLSDLGVQRHAQALLADGYRPEAIAGALGVPVESLTGGAVPAAPGQLPQQQVPSAPPGALPAAPPTVAPARPAAAPDPRRDRAAAAIARAQAELGPKASDDDVVKRAQELMAR